MWKNIPIWRDANRLMLEIEQAVRHFPRYHKYTLGSELRGQAMMINRLVSRAWRDKQQALKHLNELIDVVDDLKIQIQLAKELRVFRNFAQFQRIAELLYGIGKQSGGWRRRVREKQQPEVARPLSGDYYRYGSHM